MTYIVLLLFVIAIGYIFLLKSEMKRLSQKLQQRLDENSQRPIDVQLMNKTLTTTVHKMNELLEREQATLTMHKREQQYVKEAISNMSHDIRTPLTAIKGYQQLLAKSSLTHEQREQLHVSERHVIRLEQLLQAFFEYSYLLTQDELAQPTTVNATAMLQEIVVGHYLAFQQKGMDARMPEHTVILHTDEQFLLRIFQNVLRNALKYGHEHVSIQMEQTAETTTFCIQNGTTTERNTQPERLLERFQTGDATRKDSVGLGLSIVALLTEKLQGTLHITHEHFIFSIRITLPNRMSWQ